MIGLNKHLAGEASTSKVLHMEHWLSSSGATSQLCECLEYIHTWVGGGSSHCIDNGYPGRPHPLCDCDVVMAISYILRSKIWLVRRLWPTQSRSLPAMKAVVTLHTCRYSALLQPLGLHSLYMFILWAFLSCMIKLSTCLGLPLKPTFNGFRKVNRQKENPGISMLAVTLAKSREVK